MASTVTTRQNPKWLAYLLHGLAGLIALAYLFFGGTKLLSDPMHVENFTRWGYPLWFMTVTGAVEVLGAILIVIPKTRFYGGALLATTMVGAVFTHIQAAEFAFIPLPLVLGLLAAFVAYGHRKVALSAPQGASIETGAAAN